MTRQMIPTGILTRRDDKMLQMDVVAEITSLQRSAEGLKRERQSCWSYYAKLMITRINLRGW